MARDENAYIRVVTASNSHLPKIIFAQLPSDEKVEVRRAVAQNPNTPATVGELR
ncbi:MAG: hypothetical protein RMY34_25735 [Aulosira sp. DedQUE10]|nr:hypothetical protein [Aulosira sp. DedQUE10]